MAPLRGLPAIPVISGLVFSLYLTGFALASALGLSGDLGLPWAVRLLGLVLAAYGVGMAGWVLRFRGPSRILESTWVTLLKLVRRVPLERPGIRTEPLVVAGPYRFVRHPLYSGVDGIAFGAALLSDHPWAYLAALAMALWFALVLAPFEERELLALFGAPYATYLRSVRRFVPVRRRAS